MQQNPFNAIKHLEYQLGVYIRQRDRDSKEGDQEKADKMTNKILQIQKEIKALKEDKPATVSVKQDGEAWKFFELGKEGNNNFYEIDKIGENTVAIGLEGGIDAFSNVSQGKSATQPIVGALSRLLGLFAEHRNIVTENKHEVNVSAKQDRGFRR